MSDTELQGPGQVCKSCLCKHTVSQEQDAQGRVPGGLRIWNLGERLCVWTRTWSCSLQVAWEVVQLGEVGEAVGACGVPEPHTGGWLGIPSSPVCTQHWDWGSDSWTRAGGAVGSGAQATQIRSGGRKPASIPHLGWGSGECVRE